MLRSKLIGTISSPGITAMLPMRESERLIVSKNNGNVEVYSYNNNNFKLVQTYPKLLRNLQSNLHSKDELIIEQFLYAEDISTIFVKCDYVLALLNSSNLHLYDRVVDKRGIDKCWVSTTRCKVIRPNKSATGNDSIVDENVTYLLYSTKVPSKLRLLIWEGRTYKQMLELSLPKSSRKKETVSSMEVTPQGDIILTTNFSIFIWNFGTSSELVKIEKILQRTYPDNLVNAVTELKRQCYKLNLDSPKANSASNSSFSNQPKQQQQQQQQQDILSLHSKSSTKSHTSTIFDRLWYKNKASNTNDHFSKDYKNNLSNNIRYAFKSSSQKDKILIIDGKTKKLFHYDYSNDSNQLFATDHTQFFNWNPMFQSINYISSGIFCMYNTKLLRFVDYENGFTFLENTISNGIKMVKKVSGIHYVVWTANDEVQLYEYKVDDGEDSHNNSSENLYNQNQNNNNTIDDAESICGLYHDTSFFQLWRKVLFYRFFLKSPYSVELCASQDPQDSLDICSMKLRDLTVMWCLQMFETLRNEMNLLSINKNNIKPEVLQYCKQLENIIIREIFDLLITFWAPPQLIIYKMFPKEIARLIEEITGQEHKCDVEKLEASQHFYTIPPDLIKKWCLPYITDMRRHFRNLLAKKQEDHNDYSIIWRYEDRKIKADLDFFLLDKHTPITIETMLTLIDSVLFKIYLIYVPSMVGPLIRVDNMCDETVMMEELRKRGMFQELVDFYYQKNMHKEALELLTETIENHSNSITKNQTHSKISNTDDMRILLVSYLKNLPAKYSDLLFEYTKKLLEGNIEIQESDLKSIFLENMEVALGRNHLKVYNFCKNIDTSFAIHYLEFIMAQKTDVDPTLYSILAGTYLIRLDNIETRNRLKSLLEYNEVYDADRMLGILNNNLAKTSGKSNEDIDYIKYLKIFPLQRLERNEEALDILFDDLENYKLSSNFCNKIFVKNSLKGEDILVYLFKKIVTKRREGSGNDPNNDMMVKFLKDHKTQLNTARMLQSLPKDIDINDIKYYLLQSIKMHSAKKNEIRIHKNILEVELVNTTYSLNKNSSRFAILTENYTCHICNRIFPTLTTEIIYLFHMNNGKDYIVHYNCGKVLQNRIDNSKEQHEHKNSPMTLSEAKMLVGHAEKNLR